MKVFCECFGKMIIFARSAPAEKFGSLQGRRHLRNERLDHSRSPTLFSPILLGRRSWCFPRSSAEKPKPSKPRTDPPKLETTGAHATSRIPVCRSRCRGISTSFETESRQTGGTKSHQNPGWVPISSPDAYLWARDKPAIFDQASQTPEIPRRTGRTVIHWFSPLRSARHPHACLIRLSANGWRFPAPGFGQGERTDHLSFAKSGTHFFVGLSSPTSTVP